jgi:RNA polymerase sigma-70 factor (ECF subfamily)
MSDEHGLIEQAVKGDKRAFTALVRRYQDRIFGFIMRMTADREAALDLTQDTFLAVYENLGGFRKEALFSTWLYQIAANKARNYIKKALREVPLPEGYDKASEGGRPDTELERREEKLLLDEAIASLPHRQKMAFNLRYFDQLKFKAVAEIMEISVSAAKTNFAEALVKLKKRLDRP